jgi:hypothetical protein
MTLLLVRHDGAMRLADWYGPVMLNVRVPVPLSPCVLAKIAVRDIDKLIETRTYRLVSPVNGVKIGIVGIGVGVYEEVR